MSIREFVGVLEKEQESVRGDQQGVDMPDGGDFGLSVLGTSSASGHQTLQHGVRGGGILEADRLRRGHNLQPVPDQRVGGF